MCVTIGLTEESWGGGECVTIGLAEESWGGGDVCDYRLD